MADSHSELMNISALVPKLSIIRLVNFIPQPAEEPEHQVPEVLPLSITKLLADSCRVSFEDVGMLWNELRVMIWGTDDFVASTLDKTILRYGPGLGLAADTLYPPTHSCIQPGCAHVSKGLCIVKVSLSFSQPPNLVLIGFRM
jgi:hypothetical protein